MSWSDDDGEFPPDVVENYELVDGRDQPVSFSCIPLCLIRDRFELDGSTDGVNSRVYLHGTTVDGSERIYKQVLAWKCSYSVKPEISVLCKGKFWIQLLRPSKRFQVTNMSTLIIMHLLHFVKYNPHAEAESVWNHLESVFRPSDVKPSELDIYYHIQLVKDAFESDTDLQKSEFMRKILGVQSNKRKFLENTSDEPMKKPNLVVDETESVNPLDLLKEKNEEEEEEEPEEDEKEDPEKEEDPEREEEGPEREAKLDETEYVNPLDLLKEKKPEEEEEEPEEDEKEEDPKREKEDPEREEEDPEMEEEDPEEEEVEDPIPLCLSNLKGELKVAEDSCFLLPSQEKEHLGVGEEKYEDNEEELEDYADDDDEELQLFDTCCAICDNGGNILCCEGPCMRSFHATRDSGESNCRSLGLSQAQVDAMSVFYCKNCRLKKHQCALCGKLGSSDTSSVAEVFCCVSAACGRFYHAHCVAKALHPKNTTQARTVEAQVAAGEMFTCPVHKCSVCSRGEDRDIHDLQFAICRRCPKAYHRKCLPQSISFVADPENKILQRAWDGLLPKRILIYCREHKLVRGLGTPARDHIVFSENSMVKNRYDVKESAIDKTVLKLKGQNAAKLSPLEGSTSKRLTHMNKRHEIVCGLKADIDVVRLSSGGNSMKGMARPGFNHMRKTQFVEGSSKSSATQGMFTHKEACHSSVSNDRRPSIKFQTSPKNIDQSEIERSVDSLIKEVNTSFSINYIQSHQRAVSCYTSPRENVEKTITMGRVKTAVKAVHSALEKLDDGCSVEDAMGICGPEMIAQIHRWKNKLQLHLGPFLHGARYTSYGRHFTKLEKLEKIVDMLHLYVKKGDMIVDFSCGSNDFSWLMSKKLKESGKNCLFKNFDIIQPKNDFNFEKKDWFSVREQELAIGSKLIIGLNPPFGFKAKLANQFIDRALQFKPKLIILIVPRETQRLDQKQPPYGLIWEDAHLLAGKSFYLPGSIDVNNKQLEQWNNVSPPLSLWSRSDWIQKHKNISIMSNHLPEVTQGLYPEQNVQQQQQQPISHFPMDGLTRHGLFSVSQNIPEQGVGYEPQPYNHLPCAQPQSSILQYLPGHEPQGYSHMLNTQPQSSIFQNLPEPHRYSQLVGAQAQYYNPVPGTQSQPAPFNAIGAQPFWPNEYRHP